MKILRILFFPFVPVYYLITWFRNKLYDLNIFKSKTYDIPIICVGNLSVGGTGKTPMIEYLVRFLKNDWSLATLSRGYKRKSKGFMLAKENSQVEDLGDEPYQFNKKFDDVLIAVDEDRRNGIQELLSLSKPPDVVLLDDGFQHRKVRAGFNILLTDYNNLYYKDIVLPTGNLREPKSGANRADVIVVTKCPTLITNAEKHEIIRNLEPNINQNVFFSSIAYDDEIFNEKQHFDLKNLRDGNFTLVTGIANPNPLIEFLNSKELDFTHIKYKDHHNFTEKEIKNLQSKNMILTTEKDYMRLKDKIEPNNLFYLPIKIEIDNKEEFNRLVKQFLFKF